MEEVKDGGGTGAISVDAAVAQSIEQNGTTPQINSSKDLERYEMRNGFAMIFNHIKFDPCQQLKERKGAKKDKDALEKVLKMLSFKVECYEDLSFKDLESKLDFVSKNFPKDADCLFVAVMTHGGKGGMLHAWDKSYSFREVWSRFTADKVPSLARKPKIFLFQACRGDTTEKAAVYGNGLDLPRGKVSSISTYFADYLFAHSSMEGYSSFRLTTEGSWFVQDFCKELEKYAGQRDILSIMTVILKNVAFHRGDENNKQMPVISSTLTKLLYFDRTPVKLKNSLSIL